MLRIDQRNSQDRPMTANGITTVPPSSGLTRRPGVAPGATTALVLLLFINMFNYIDRQVLAALEPDIEKAFFPLVGNLSC